MSDALVKLKENAGSLNPAEQAAAEYIIKNPEEASTISIHELAKRAYVSPSAVVRMCHDIGYAGFKEFRHSLLGDLASRKQEQLIAEKEIEKEDEAEDIIHKITSINIRSLYETERLMDPDILDECVTLIEKADRVILFGMGASWLAARDCYEKLLRVNKSCVLNEDWHLQLLSAINSSPDDVAIMISYSGHTEEMIECMKELNNNNTPVIAITRSVKSPISEMADHLLYTTSTESLFRSAAMGSLISQMSIIDMLYTVYANRSYENSIALLRRTHIRKP